MGEGFPGTDSGYLAQSQKPGPGVLLRPSPKPVLALLARLTGNDRPATIEEKKSLILNSGLALWDTLAHCTIVGARDETIEDPVPNDIAGLLARAPVEAIFCNGAAAWKFYEKFARPLTGIKAVKLPSTSPANAAWSLDRLQEAWGQALGPYLVKKP